MRNAEQDALLLHGFVRCDIPACNCGSWHPRYGLPERMQEIKDMLAESGHELCNENGNLPRNALRQLIAERDTLREAAYNNSVRANRYYCLLMDEHHLRMRGTSPWECSNNDCPYVDKPMVKECNCFRDRYEHHMRQIAALWGEAE